MAGGSREAIIGAAAAARARGMCGKTGLRALWSDKRTVYIAVFASLVCDPHEELKVRIVGHVSCPLYTSTFSGERKWTNICAFVAQGGYLYGYQQGVLGQALVMNSFLKKFPSIAHNEGAQGWLTSILQLGGWIGSLTSGILCEVFSRKITLFSGALWVVLGSYLTAGASAPSYLYAGRFFTGTVIFQGPPARLIAMLIHL